MNAVIQAIDSSVPQRRVTNDELAATLDTSDEWIRSHTGIGCRHIADASQSPSDLAADACRKVLDRAGLPAGEVDLILVATASADFAGFPSTASIVQDLLGARKAGAMDLAAGCTGFIYGLETARCYVASGGARNVLVVGAEVLSRITNWKDRNTAVLLGDGAGAALVSAADPSETRGIIRSILRSDGSGARLLERTAGGTRFPYTEGKTPPEDLFLKMDGRQVYNFAVKVVSVGIRGMLADAGLSVDELAWIVPHQANERIIEAAANRAKIPLGKFYINIEEYANTGAASIPIALSEMNSRGLLKAGDLVLTFGFGAGLTYGGNLIRW